MFLMLITHLVFTVILLKNTITMLILGVEAEGQEPPIGFLA